MTLIAEDLLLLLCEDDSGRLTHTTNLDAGLGGALLVELALAGCVTVVEQERRWGFGAASRVRATGTLPGDPVLREALEVVAEKERTAQDLVGRLGRRRREPLLDRLVAAGILRRQDDTVLGLFPRTRWPAADSSHEAEVRGRLEDVLLRGAEPDERTAALASLLAALEVAHKVVAADGVPGREVRRRAREVAEGDWAAQGVKDAVAAAEAAMVAVMVATTAATTAGSS